jgi:hypothetical protein
VLAVCGSGAAVARSLCLPILAYHCQFSPNRDKLNRQIQEVERLVTRRKQTMTVSSNRQKFQICKTKNLAAAGASSTNLSAFLIGGRAHVAQVFRPEAVRLRARAVEPDGTFLRISTRFWPISRNRRNSLKTNARRISTRFQNCTSAVRMRVLLPGKVDANDVVFYFDHAAGVFARGFLTQLLHRGVVGAAVEPAGVVDQQNVAAHGMAVDGGELLLDGRGDVVIVRVEPEKAGLFERGQELRQNFSAVTLKNVNVRALCEFSPSAFRPPAIELNRVNLAKPVLVHVEHVREVRSGLDQNLQIEFAGELRDRSLFHQVRRAGSGYRAKFPRSIFAASGNTFVEMKEPAIAERLPEFRHDPATSRSEMTPPIIASQANLGTALGGDVDFLLGGGEHLFDGKREHGGGVRVQADVVAAKIIGRLGRNVLDHGAARKRAVAFRVGGAEKADNARAKRSGQMQRAGVAGDNETRLIQKRGQRGNRERNDGRIRWARSEHDFASEIFFARPDIDHRAQPVAPKKRSAERAESVRRPALRFPAAAGTDDNVFAGNAFARKRLADSAQFIFRYSQRKARLGLRLCSGAHG